MKKISVMLMLTGLIIFTGCVGNQAQPMKSQESSSAELTLTFDHELFALDLPVPFEANDSTIKPKREKDFPQIVYEISEMPNEGSLLSIEVEGQKNLCDQTDACGQITESEEVTINNVNGIKFGVQYDGRSVDDQAGYVIEYHYSLQDGENLFRFWTSVSDLDSPEEVSKKFDKIIETISFK